MKKINSTLLIIDDQMESIALLLVYLKGQPLDIQVALNGEDGLRKAIEGQPDAILLDVRMPDMDGYEVCRRLKADQRTAAAPVIFLSANFSVKDKLLGFSAGGVDYINKPFSAEEVLARIYVHLNLFEEIERLESSLFAPELQTKNKELNRDDKILLLALSYMQSNLTEWPGLEKLAQLSFSNERKLEGLFKKHFGMTAYGYLLELRLNKARGLLTDTGLQIKAIAEQAGYQNASDFSRAFRRRYSLGPRQYRQTSQPDEHLE